MKVYDKADLVEALKVFGVEKGDLLLIRAGLGSVGRIKGGAAAFVDALLEAVGPEGTIITLAFTSGATYIRKPKIEDAFDITKKSYAGALPNGMLKNASSFRSKHPMCSYVAIGKYAEYLTKDHDENSLAYEPIRKVIELRGKCILIGCVKDSPGFTTTHLAESDLGLLKLSVFPRLLSVYYKNKSGDIELFRRSDPGLCSKSFYKFYAHYVAEGILKTGHIGHAYSIIADANLLYNIDKEILEKDKLFNICGSPDCFVCNVGRWDRIYRAPFYLIRRILSKIKRIIKKQ